jgi:hypothetical protein
VHDTIIEYTVNINTTIYWLFININYMAMCFDQRLVIFRAGCDITIKLRLQIHVMVRLRSESFV